MARVDELAAFHKIALWIVENRQAPPRYNARVGREERPIRSPTRDPGPQGPGPRRGGKPQEGRRRASGDAGSSAGETLKRTLLRPQGRSGEAHERRGREADPTAAEGRALEGERPGGDRRPRAPHRVRGRTDSRREQGSGAGWPPALRGEGGPPNGRRAARSERATALREGKPLKVESQERYRDETSPERSRGAETGESVRNAGAGAWRARQRPRHADPRFRKR
jgi:hypothetical protein